MFFLIDSRLANEQEKYERDFKNICLQNRFYPDVEFYG